MQQTLSWALGYHTEKSDSPETWIAAGVPGAVQSDVAKAEKYQPYYYDDHYKDYLWMEDKYWTYRASFKKPETGSGDCVYFISKGIDYAFDIFLNGKHLLSQEGMFTPVRLDITDDLMEENTLKIVIHPVPKATDRPDRSQARLSVKPAVSYGWDWHPRLVPTGIWDATYINVVPKQHWLDADFNYRLSDDLQQADLALRLTGRNLCDCHYVWELTDPENKRVHQSQGCIAEDELTLFVRLNNIELWWPQGQGNANLYVSKVILKDSSGQVADESIQKIGFRRVRLVMNEGAWEQPKAFPKSRSVPPITIEINGRRIFARGSNWVPPEIFPGALTDKRYRELLELIVGANFNIVRVWGGGIVNKESFFEFCDELGIMVWQDFPLACLDYPDDSHYLGILKQEAVSIIRKVKQHPCHVLWCGGNELFNAWSGMTDQSLALRLLNALCLDLDPQTPFIPTAPVMGMAHGHYVFRDEHTGEEPFQWMPRSQVTAYTEFSIPSPSHVDVIRKCIPEEILFPPRPGTAWEEHHGYHAWQGNTWLCEPVIEHYFGKSGDLETLVKNGQFLQSAGYRFMFEEARRQWPYCSMALNWCFEDVWPTAASCALVNYPLHPKPALKAVALACRPVLASARVPKFMWEPGEMFAAELFLLNDSPAAVSQGEMQVFIHIGKEKYSVLQWAFDEVPALKNLEGPTMKFSLPDIDTDHFQLILEVNDCPDICSEYTFLLRRPVVSDNEVTRRLNA